MNDNDTAEEKAIDVTALGTERLEALRDEIETELGARESEYDLDDAASVDLVNGKWAKWGTLSAHANLKAVKPWIMHVTGEHSKYGVDGDWLDKQTIDGAYHMDVSGLDAGDFIKVSGASHSNKKHRYYRVLAVDSEKLYYERAKESEVLEGVSA